MKKIQIKLIALLAVVAGFTGCELTENEPAPVQVQPVTTYVSEPTPVPPVPPSPKLTGYLRSIGSDSMDTVMLEWEAAFGDLHPSLKFRHEGKGSSTAIPALLEGRSDFGPMSRELKSSEVEKFSAKFGYAPIQFSVAVDSLAVYVHPENPILNMGLSLDQLKRIFADVSALDGAAPIERWGELGFTGDWANAPVIVHGRNDASGTYDFFQEKALKKAPFKGSIIIHSGSQGVVEAVAAERFAIGYSGIAYKTDEVGVVSIADATGRFVKPDRMNSSSGAYPITRQLYLTLNLDPSLPPTELQRQFMRFVYSPRGQSIISEVGYYPVSASVAQQALKVF